MALILKMSEENNVKQDECTLRRMSSQCNMVHPLISIFSVAHSLKNMFKSSQLSNGKVVHLQEELWIPRKGSYGGIGGGGVTAHVLGRHVSLPLTSCSGLLLVILDGHNEEDEQGDTLNPCQEEEVVVQRAVVDVTCRDEK